MLALDLRPQPGSALRLLCLGAHADDIEIGCGGLILDLLGQDAAVEIDWVVFSASSRRAREARASARAFLRGASRARVVVRRFPDGFFPSESAAIKREMERLRRQVPSPDLVLTHYRDDRHQDHRQISDVTWNTFRDHLILEYEVPKYDGDLGVPNCYRPIDRDTCARKIQYIHSAFASQREKHWFGADTFEALMRLRGIECRAPGGYAEAFYARKVVLGL